MEVLLKGRLFEEVFIEKNDKVHLAIGRRLSEYHIYRNDLLKQYAEVYTLKKAA